MGISVEPVIGRGILFDQKNKHYEYEVLSFVNYLDSSINEYEEDILEITMRKLGIMDIDLTYQYIENSRNEKTFVKILSEKGEEILKGFNKKIVEVNDICYI